VYLQEENPYSLGEEKPYKLPQLDKKNPNLPYLYVAAALQAYSYILYRPPWIV
jgi:hypothetical protein